MKSVYSGGCQCGAVRYATYGKPLSTSTCHCRMCQKAVGGPFAVFVAIRDSDFAWTRGTPATFWSSNVAARDFCAACGTPLTFRYKDEPQISVSVGSLDQPDEVRPKIQYGTESRLSWMHGEVLDSLPEEETGDTPEDAKRLAGLATYQHPDHDTPPDWKPPASA